MIKDIITYNGKDYQISTVKMYAKAYVYFETAIFPIENDIPTGNEVYRWKTYNVEESHDKHIDILNRPEKYLSEESVAEYMKSKLEGFYKETRKIPFPFQYMEQYFRGEISFDDAIDRTIEEVYRLIGEYVERHKLQEG